MPFISTFGGGSAGARGFGRAGGGLPPGLISASVSSINSYSNFTSYYLTDTSNAKGDYHAFVYGYSLNTGFVDANSNSLDSQTPFGTSIAQTSNGFLVIDAGTWELSIAGAGAAGMEGDPNGSSYDGGGAGGSGACFIASIILTEPALVDYQVAAYSEYQGPGITRPNPQASYLRLRDKDGTETHYVYTSGAEYNNASSGWNGSNGGQVVTTIGSFNNEFFFSNGGGSGMYNDGRTCYGGLGFGAGGDGGGVTGNDEGQVIPATGNNNGSYYQGNYNNSGNGAGVANHGKGGDQNHIFDSNPHSGGGGGGGLWSGSPGGRGGVNNGGDATSGLGIGSGGGGGGWYEEEKIGADGAPGGIILRRVG